MAKYVVEVVDAGVVDTLAVFDSRSEAERFLKAVRDYHESIRQPITVRIREVEEPVPVDVLVLSALLLVILAPAITSIWMGVKHGQLFGEV